MIKLILIADWALSSAYPQAAMSLCPYVFFIKELRPVVEE